jgi:nucleolar protein 56
MNIIFKNILGDFVIDQNYNISKKDKKHVRLPDDKDYYRILKEFKNNKYYQLFRQKNIELTKSKIKNSIRDDQFIIQSSVCINELNKSLNTHTKRLREWISYPMPELNERTKDDNILIDELLNFKKININDEMSLEIDKKHILEIQNLCNLIKNIEKQKKDKIKYLTELMEKNCPNLNTVAGTLIGAKLITQAGNIEKLAMSAASKIQLLGAEDALFRHLKTGAKTPKHGFIHDHPLINKSKYKDKGKMARRLADKISIAAKIDFFKGEYIGDKLREELEK